MIMTFVRWFLRLCGRHRDGMFIVYFFTNMIITEIYENYGRIAAVAKGLASLAMCRAFDSRNYHKYLYMCAYDIIYIHMIFQVCDMYVWKLFP